MLRRTVLLAMMMAGLSACMSSEPAAKVTPIPVGRVSVSLAENASYGLLQATQDPALTKSFSAQLGAALNADAVTRGAANTAEVVVSRVTIQSGASRTVAAAESRVTGDVIVRDGSGKTLRRIDDVSFANKAARNTSTINGLPIGALISMANNAQNASPEKQISLLAQGFSKVIAGQLGR